MTTKTAAEVFPVGHYIQEELDERGWTVVELALRMNGVNVRKVGIDQLAVELLMAVNDPKLLLDKETAEKLGLAFDVQSGFFLNLDRAYREWKTK